MFAGHGRFDEVVARAVRRDFGVDQALAHAEVVSDAGINDDHRQAVQARKHIGAGAALQVVLHHLPAHVLRVGRDASGRRAVVAGKDQHVRLGELRRECLLDASNLECNFLKLPQRTERLRFVVDLVLQCGVEFVADRADVKRHDGTPEKALNFTPTIG